MADEAQVTRARRSTRRPAAGDRHARAASAPTTTPPRTTWSSSRTAPVVTWWPTLSSAKAARKALIGPRREPHVQPVRHRGACSIDADPRPRSRPKCARPLPAARCNAPTTTTTSLCWRAARTSTPRRQRWRSRSRPCSRTTSPDSSIVTSTQPAFGRLFHARRAARREWAPVICTRSCSPSSSPASARRSRAARYPPPAGLLRVLLALHPPDARPLRRDVRHRPRRGADRHVDTGVHRQARHTDAGRRSRSRVPRRRTDAAADGRDPC